MAILSKGYKPDNFVSHNSQKLSFTNICGLPLNFVECESFLESNSPDILALCKTNLDDSVDSGNFPLTVYLPLMQKYSITHMHGLAVYVKKGLTFAWGLSLKNYGFLLMFLTDFTYFTQVSSFCSINHLHHIYAWFLILSHLT